MSNILFNKFLKDCLIFFIICLISTSTIIWMLQAVNFLDIIVEDGRDYNVYIKYSLYSFPKIIDRLIPFTFFISFFYVISRYEINNELLIFWNFGINKLRIINFFLKFSFLLVLTKIILSSYIVPASQNEAKTFIRDSKSNIYENFIKPKKFIDSIKSVTIFFEDKNEEGELKNIYLKRDSLNNNFQITYAKKGRFFNKDNSPFLILFDGTTTTYRGKKLSSFKFLESKFNFSDSETNTTTYIKTQEMKTIYLVECVLRLKKIKSSLFIENEEIANCNENNFQNIIKELSKRIFLSFYISVLMLIALFLIIRSKENINYLNYRISIFLSGVLVIIISEISLEFLKDNMALNFLIIFMPIILLVIFYTILNLILGRGYR